MKKIYLKPNLSFKEFEELAANIPKRRQKTIFKLVVFSISCTDLESPDKYPEYQYDETTKGFFKTKKDAEKGFSKCYDWAENNFDHILFFKIFEMPLNMISDFGKYGNNGAIREYLYDKTGTLIDYTVCSRNDEDYCSKYGLYLGKPKRLIRFKEGDLVEIMDNGKMKLAIVAHNPIDTEWCYNYYLRGCENGYGYHLDASDDQVAVIDGFGYASHQHIPLCDIMKPLFPIPEHIKNRFDEYYQYMVRESIEYKNKIK